MENDQWIEEKSPQRIVGLPRDIQHIQNYENKIQNENGKETPVPLTPERDSRKNYKKIQAKEEQKWHTLKIMI